MRIDDDQATNEVIAQVQANPAAGVTYQQIGSNWNFFAVSGTSL